MPLEVAHYALPVPAGGRGPGLVASTPGTVVVIDVLAALSARPEAEPGKGAADAQREQ